MINNSYNDVFTSIHCRLSYENEKIILNEITKHGIQTCATGYPYVMWYITKDTVDATKERTMLAYGRGRTFRILHSGQVGDKIVLYIDLANSQFIDAYKYVSSEWKTEYALWEFAPYLVIGNLSEKLNVCTKESIDAAFIDTDFYILRNDITHHIGPIDMYDSPNIYE